MKTASATVFTKLSVICKAVPLKSLAAPRFW